MRLSYLYCILIAICLGLTADAVLAAKPSNVVKLNGIGDAVRVDPRGEWLALWVANTRGEYELYVVNATDGERKGPIVAADLPGGMCWIPGYDRLLFSEGYADERAGVYKATYYTYSTVSDEHNKVREVNDILDTFMLDPLASDSGDTVFTMTMDKVTISDSELVTVKPHFYFYDANARLLETTGPSSANITSDYDLTADGQMLWWHLQEQDSRELFILGWSFAKNDYSKIITYSADSNPADDLVLFRIDSVNSMAAAIAYSDTDPQLQLTVFRFVDPSHPTAIPIRLNPGELVIDMDWRGRTGTLYAVVRNERSNEHSIIEINPLSGARTTLLNSRDVIYSAVYNNKLDTYFYVVVDDRGNQTTIVRLKRD